jgi:hypothetical protein
VKTVVTLDDGRDDYNCSPNSTGRKGGQGVTIWGPYQDIHLTANGGSSGLLTFTCTEPKCYNSKDFCNIKYTIHTESTSSNDVVGYVRFIHYSGYDEQNNSYQYSHESKQYHSKIAEHDLTESIDISQYDHYEDTGRMALEFVNNDPQIDIWIQGLQIVRGYMMTWLDYQPGNCPPEDEHSGIYDFTTRYDYPCSFDCCGGVSFTGYGCDNHYYVSGTGTIITRGNNNIYSWTWSNPPAYNNYVGPMHCIFNFNNVCLITDQGDFSQNVQAQTDDVPFLVKLNNSNWVYYYQPKRNSNFDNPAHGIDLATHTYLYQFYNDNPNGSNTLSLKIPSTDPQVNFAFRDGATSIDPGYGRVNVYRVYQTSSICGSPCQTCNTTCNTGCEITCYGCDSCYGCQAACQFFCVTCDACYGSCQGCQDPCEASCQGCDSYVPCQSCDSCEGCYACNPCQGCQPCETCYSCASCYEDCYEACYEGCYGG